AHPQRALGAGAHRAARAPGPLRRGEGFDHGRRHQPDGHRRRRRARRRRRERVHRVADPGHARPDHPRHQAARGAGEPRSRRDREVHRAAAGPPRAGDRRARRPGGRRPRRCAVDSGCCGGRAMNHLFGWADVVAFRLGGETVRWSDLLGNLLGLATVALALRRSLWTWPVQITGAILLFGADMAVHLGGTAARQLAVIALAGYGWARWQRAREGGARAAADTATGGSGSGTRDSARNEADAGGGVQVRWATWQE